MFNYVYNEICNYLIISIFLLKVCYNEFGDKDEY